jgi:hypothetical protein
LVLVFSGLIFGFQFMLIWYANIPEEITYFITRMMYNPVFRCCYELCVPILILINSDFKRISWILVMAGVVLAGHYIDFFNMVMPGTVGDRWFIVSEIASMFFLGYLSLLCLRWLNILATKKKSLHRRE